MILAGVCFLMGNDFADFGLRMRLWINEYPSEEREWTVYFL